jgi:hypothetical protein
MKIRKFLFLSIFQIKIFEAQSLSIKESLLLQGIVVDISKILPTAPFTPVGVTMEPVSNQNTQLST